MSATADRLRPPRLPGGRLADPALLGLLAASAAALWLAADAGVSGPGAVPDTVRGALAALVLFAVCGYAPARVLTPERAAGHLALLVLPFGAAASGFALTALGFLRVPFDVSLPVVLVAGAGLAVFTRWRLGPAPALDRSGRRGLFLAVWVALLVAAVALVPTMRNGYATVVRSERRRRAGGGRGGAAAGGAPDRGP